MTIQELLAEIKNHENDTEFNTYLDGKVTADRVNKFLATEEGKKLLQPQLDSYFNKGLETWKTNNLEGLVNAKVKELYPDEDPKDTEIAKMKAEIEKMKADTLRANLKNSALKIATEKGLPTDLVDYFIGADEKSTKANMDNFNKYFSTAVSGAVENKLKGNAHIPPEGSDPEIVDGVTKRFMELNPGMKIS